MMPTISEALSELRACVESALCTKCPTIIIPGTLPVTTNTDYAYVRLVTSYPSRRFPAQDGDWSACGGPLAYVVEVGVVHCLTLQNNTVVPTVESMQKVAQSLAQEMTDLHSIFACCLEGWDLLLGNWTPIGPQGNLVGGTWTFTITPTWG